jgi:PIN domain nuclease of toxin-antitoxin system
VRLLIDTHAFIWWLAGDGRLSPAAHTAIADETSEVFVSAATIWEATTKHRLGKLPSASALALDPLRTITGQGFQHLSITPAHAAAAGKLPGPHRDPFDRMLIAQAMIDDLVLISNEAPFDLYGVRRLW